MSSIDKLSGHQIHESIHILLQPKMISISKRRQYEDTESFRNVYRYRAGIEAAITVQSSNWSQTLTCKRAEGSQFRYQSKSSWP
jgi:hypothetical protein